MEVPTQSTDLQAQCSLWKSEVEQVRGSLRQMRGRLEEMAAGRHTNHERMVEIEHFQNQFIRQLEVADEMFHDLKQSAKTFANGRPAIVHLDRPVDDYDTLHDRMQVFHKLHDELKGEFNRFESYR
ncbi:hypothetical protein DLD77_08895 [Chitinophaga alhagiae]|uniref:Uncharacterized protein n=1 Tax=Chitinophaga alhagiae TaxID=2203219 RepID=A0ABN5LS99_9BACT|nr:hypothetical protein [Chitinophaga alhagiae]AWO01804.1 hypothetical protein DLD77_08895 [Chitinophaga alhagiae]